MIHHIEGGKVVSVTFNSEELTLLSKALELAYATCITLEADKNEEEGYVEVELLNALQELKYKGITPLELVRDLKTG